MKVRSSLKGRPAAGTWPARFVGLRGLLPPRNLGALFLRAFHQRPRRGAVSAPTGTLPVFRTPPEATARGSLLLVILRPQPHSPEAERAPRVVDPARSRCLHLDTPVATQGNGAEPSQLNAEERAHASQPPIRRARWFTQASETSAKKISALARWTNFSDGRTDGAGRLRVDSTLRGCIPTNYWPRCLLRWGNRLNYSSDGAPDPGHEPSPDLPPPGPSPHAPMLRIERACPR